MSAFWMYGAGRARHNDLRAVGRVMEMFCVKLRSWSGGTIEGTRKKEIIPTHSVP